LIFEIASMAEDTTTKIEPEELDQDMTPGDLIDTLRV
jgi:hypothetical protein